MTPGVVPVDEHPHLERAAGGGAAVHHRGHLIIAVRRRGDRQGEGGHLRQIIPRQAGNVHVDFPGAVFAVVHAAQLTVFPLGILEKVGHIHRPDALGQLPGVQPGQRGGNRQGIVHDIVREVIGQAVGDDHQVASLDQRRGKRQLFLSAARLQKLRRAVVDDHGEPGVGRAGRAQAQLQGIDARLGSLHGILQIGAGIRIQELLYIRLGLGRAAESHAQIVADSPLVDHGVCAGGQLGIRRLLAGRGRRDEGGRGAQQGDGRQNGNRPFQGFHHHSTFLSRDRGVVPVPAKPERHKTRWKESQTTFLPTRASLSSLIWPTRSEWSPTGRKGWWPTPDRPPGFSHPPGLPTGW